MTVEAGCLLADVQAAAEAADRYFPLALGSEGSCQIGGNLSTNAGGLNAVRYGVARDLALGLEVVLADGRMLDGLTSLRKDNTGYDLRDLFIGAEGTLGVITAASLKLFPRPRSVETAFARRAGPRRRGAAARRACATATGDAVTSFEFLPRIAVELAVRHMPGRQRSARPAARRLRAVRGRHRPRRSRHCAACSRRRSPRRWTPAWCTMP